jgi:hypothetical protein
MSRLMQSMLYPYMAPHKDGEDLPTNEAELSKLRGDEVEDLEEDEVEAAKDDEEEEEEPKSKKKDDEEEEEEPKSKKKDDADEEEEEEPKAKVKDDKKQVIPKARFDELRTKSKAQIEALNKEVEDLRKKSAADTRVDDTKKTEDAIANLEKEIDALMADGKTGEAMGKMREVRILERALITAEAKFSSDQARAVAVEQVRLDLMVERLEQEYPQINPDADEYDQDLVDEVMELKSAFEKAGKSSSEALSKAVKYVLADKIAAKDEKATDKKKDDEEEEGEEDEKPKKASKDKGSERKKEAIKRNAKDATKIPAKTDEHGVDSNKKGGAVTTKDVMKMTEEEFEALPESTKARLRGDVLDD